MAKAVEREPKKPYEKPKLTVYGNVREITRAVANMGNMDGGVLGGHMMSHL